MRAHANDFVVQNYSSVEIRLLLLEMYAQGRLSEDNIEYIVEQTSNNKLFKITSKKSDDSFLISLIPEYRGEYRFPSIGTWQLLFDKHGKIQYITYYIQADKNHRIILSPYKNSSEVSVVIGGYFLYENILIPLSIRSFFKMPLHQFFIETKQLLYWDWVFSERKFNETNEKSRNLSVYLTRQFDKEGEKQKRLNNLFNNDILVLSGLERNQILAQRRNVETAYIKRNIDYIMNYIGTDLVDESMFDPYDINKNKITNVNEEYLSIYIENVVDFLMQFPDYYTPVKTLDTPFFEEVSFQELDQLYVRLYLLTTKNPGLWFIVPIQKIVQEGEQTTRTTISMEILIPYFLPDGTFKIYGYDNVQQYLKDQKTSQDENRNVTYLYKKVGILRVPNQRNNTTIIKE